MSDLPQLRINVTETAHRVLDWVRGMDPAQRSPL